MTPTPDPIRNAVQQVFDHPGLRELNQELRQQAELQLQNLLEKMALVPREEFDIQSKVLARTRALVTQLEQRIDKLEAQANNDQT